MNITGNLTAMRWATGLNSEGEYGHALAVSYVDPSMPHLGEQVVTVVMDEDGFDMVQACIAEHVENHAKRKAGGL